MATKLEWHGPEQKARIEAELKRRLAACAIVVASHAKQLISIAGTGVGRHKKTGKFKTAYGANPSAPGEPPHKQTGQLRGSITWELVGLTARVGTNLMHGLYTEMGTRKMAARPWLKRSLMECRAKLLAILQKPMN